VVPDPSLQELVGDRQLCRKKNEPQDSEQEHRAPSQSGRICTREATAAEFNMPAGE